MKPASKSILKTFTEKKLRGRFAFTKLGKYMLENGEGWMLQTDNILTEPDPEKINWKLLPDGEQGLRLPKFGSIQEEHNHVETGDNQLYLVYLRTSEAVMNQRADAQQ